MSRAEASSIYINYEKQTYIQVKHITLLPSQQSGKHRSNVIRFR